MWPDEWDRQKQHQLRLQRDRAVSKDELLAKLWSRQAVIFPIPNRRLSKRLYRLTAPTLVLWGKSDALIPPVYAERFRALIPQEKLALIDQAGHMIPYEQPAEFVRLTTAFLS